MDPVSIILTALTLGATEGLKKTGESAVVDAYQMLKKYVSEKFHKVPIEQIEKDPADQQSLDFAKSVITSEGCSSDQVLLEICKSMIELLNKSDTAGEVINISVVDNSTSTESGVAISRSTINAPITVVNEKNVTSASSDRFERFIGSDEFTRLKESRVKHKRPSYVVELLVIGCILLPVFGLGLIFIGIAMYQHDKHDQKNIESIPVIVTRKDDGNKGLDLLLESGANKLVKTPSKLFDKVSVGSMGMAFIVGADLQEFLVCSE